MIRIEHDAEPGATPDATLTLPFELRKKSRLRARLDGGEEVALLLTRGRVLRGGDLLRASDARVVEVRAAAERVSTVTAGDREALLRGAYHLGNRHVPVQVGQGFLRYEHDHVLDDMVRGLGLSVTVEQASFEPEGGAYAGHGHGASGHGHAHGHGHEAGNDHGHAGHAHAHGHDHDHDHSHPHARLRIWPAKSGPR